MNSNKQRISAVPTNIITGFLGSGKTSTILHLIKSKPKNERWAVLVNEFGEIGVDGSLFQGQHSEEQGIFIKEVPGGCMCCVAGLSLQISLNQLLLKARPDRLLIEPTGLGHPIEVLQVLSTKAYENVLSLQKTLTLVDARKLADSRYTEHETFNQQIQIADTLVVNKTDLYKTEDKENLNNYLKQSGKDNMKVYFTQYGAVELSALEGSTDYREKSALHSHNSAPQIPQPLASELDIPACGFIKAENQGEGFYSVGWRFAPEKVFDRKKLFALISGLQVERLKAVFITEEGIFGYNLTSDTLTEIEIDDCFESRIEVIATKLDDKLHDKLQQQLFACESLTD